MFRNVAKINIYIQTEILVFSFELIFIFVFFENLQGQMLYIAETDLILFQCYPSVMNLDDLTK